MPEPVYETLLDWNCSSKPLAMASACQNIDNSRGAGFRKLHNLLLYIKVKSRRSISNSKTPYQKRYMT
jgi:hypothetical protein